MGHQRLQIAFDDQFAPFGEREEVMPSGRRHGLPEARPGLLGGADRKSQDGSGVAGAWADATRPSRMRTSTASPPKRNSMSAWTARGRENDGANWQKRRANCAPRLSPMGMEGASIMSPYYYRSFRQNKYSFYKNILSIENFPCQHGKSRNRPIRRGQRSRRSAASVNGHPVTLCKASKPSPATMATTRSPSGRTSMIARSV